MKDLIEMQGMQSDDDKRLTGLEETVRELIRLIEKPGTYQLGKALAPQDRDVWTANMDDVIAQGKRILNKPSVQRDEEDEDMYEIGPLPSPEERMEHAATYNAHLAEMLERLAKFDGEELTFTRFSMVNATRAMHLANCTSLKYWTVDQWIGAVLGELGEAANVQKKRNRLKIKERAPEEYDDAELRKQLEDEVADTFIYLDLLATRLGFSLIKAVVRKFNKYSKKVGLGKAFRL